MPHLSQLVTQLVLPAVFRWLLRNEDPVSLGGESRDKGEVATVSAHDLEHEAALVAGCSGGYVINGFEDAMESRVSSNGHVRATEVVVYRAHHAHNVQVGALVSFFLANGPYTHTR